LAYANIPQGYRALQISIISIAGIGAACCTCLIPKSGSFSIPFLRNHRALNGDGVAALLLAVRGEGGEPL